MPAGIRVDDPKPQVIEDFRPLHLSVQWELQRAYYEQLGLGAFTSGSVPFKATSGGRIARDAAEILLASLTPPARQRGRIVCVELGPGSGLFAKLLLDEIRRLCAEFGRDDYNRIEYVLADSSQAMLDGIAASGLLTEHGGRYRLERANPLRPATAARDEPGLHAVFLNYVLDSLPASVVRRQQNGLEQLCTRVSLERVAPLSEHSELALSELMAVSAAREIPASASLGDVYSPMVVDMRYEPVNASELPESEALEAALPAASTAAVVHGHAALACLRGLTERLVPGGFVLLNDYPSSDPNDITSGSPYQRFGGAIAIGLNFAQIELVAGGWPWCRCHRPPRDDKRLVLRMIERDATAEAIDRFRFLFDRSRVTEVRARADHARTLLHERRFDGARDAFAEALEVAPNDWALLEEAAEFTTYIVRDLGLGAELARRALTINPIAPGVWNILGDCELHQGRPRAALNCYRRAIELNPHEVRGRYNASYALSAQRDIPGALQMTAEGLALDSGTYRDRLLRRQARLLDRLNQP